MDDALILVMFCKRNSLRCRETEDQMEEAEGVTSEFGHAAPVLECEGRLIAVPEDGMEEVAVRFAEPVRDCHVVQLALICLPKVNKLHQLLFVQAVTGNVHDLAGLIKKSCLSAAGVFI